MRKNWRVSLSVQELYHPRDFLWILAAIPVCRNTTGLTVLNRGLRFYVVLNIWLAWSRSPRSFLSTCSLDTDTGEESIPHRSSLVLVSLSLWYIPGCWVDELEEDVDDQSPAWRCHRCEEGKLEEDLVGKPGTHHRNEVLCVSSVSEYRFWWDVVFDHWSIHKSIHVHRKAFRAIKLLAYPRGLSLSRIYPILWRKQWPLRASCTSPLAVMTIVGLHDFVKVSISRRIQVLCCWSWASTLRSRQQILFPQV